jgi:hypothetical protein
MQRLIDVNILRGIVHQVGFIYKIMHICTVNKTHTKKQLHMLRVKIVIRKNYFGKYTDD